MSAHEYKRLCTATPPWHVGLLPIDQLQSAAAFANLTVKAITLHHHRYHGTIPWSDFLDQGFMKAHLHAWSVADLPVLDEVT